MLYIKNQKQEGGIEEKGEKTETAVVPEGEPLVGQTGELEVKIQTVVEQSHEMVE